MSLSRRSFVSATAATALCAAVLPRSAYGQSQSARKRIAFIGTEVRQHSHAQHFLDRHAMGYTWGGKWQAPRFDIASVYIDQFPEGDLGKQRIEKYKLKSFSSIADALTLGTSKLAVDGVVIIAEHGDYPANEKKQRLYPRYKWFKEVVKVFESSGVAYQYSMTASFDGLERMRRDGAGLEAASIRLFGRFFVAGDVAFSIHRYALWRTAGGKCVRVLWRC